MAAPQQPRFVPFVTDLGLKSDLNMHRAHSGSFRVRIEARQRVVAAIDFQKADLRVEQRPNGLRQQGILSPFPFPPGASRGGDGSPHAGSTPRASKKRWHTSMLPAPPTRGLPPPCASPACIRHITEPVRRARTLEHSSIRLKRTEGDSPRKKNEGWSPRRP